tara:strand:+ start:241 stop:627 length:387 start_codon:yes stop_codon:yes gene_type:complete
MFGFGPKLPVTRDPVDGFLLTKSIQEEVHQNLKNLILTSPGERIMIPNFGVGLRQYLFEQNTAAVSSLIRERINSQVKKYMPFVELNKIIVVAEPSNKQGLLVSIRYSVPSLSLVNVLSIGASAQRNF